MTPLVLLSPAQNSLHPNVGQEKGMGRSWDVAGPYNSRGVERRGQREEWPPSLFLTQIIRVRMVGDQAMASQLRTRILGPGFRLQS